jgi:L-lysine exporter family protein LysE/ArgO
MRIIRWSDGFFARSVVSMFTVVLSGLLTGFALIVAIGAQNAFVLRQGIRGEHIGAVILTCLLCDVVGIAAGVAGIGAVLARWPAVVPVATIGGGIYLLAFGGHAAFRAWRPESLEAGEPSPLSRRAAVLMALALAWLNPHFYLDTMLMLGTVANAFGDARWWFFAGTLTASTVWFVGLGLGARALRGFFARPVAWRALDTVIALIMGGLGVGLLVTA